MPPDLNHEIILSAINRKTVFGMENNYDPDNSGSKDLYSNNNNVPNWNIKQN